MQRLGVFLFFLVAGWTSGRAETLEELIGIHKEAIGGARVDACSAIEATGAVKIGERELNFEFVAARPNRVRLKLHTGGRVLVQATDGVSPPWQADSAKPAVPETMTGEAAREFMADAEFDDPLVSPAERGFTLDFAGEVQEGDRKLFKILVTRAGTPPSFLLLDGETYFIVARQTTQKQPSGRAATVETRYSDFRPMAGVIFSHRISVWIEGRLTRETVLSDIREIPDPGTEPFVQPFVNPVAAPAAGATP